MAENNPNTHNLAPLANDSSTAPIRRAAPLPVIRQDQSTCVVACLPPHLYVAIPSAKSPVSLIFIPTTAREEIMLSRCSEPLLSAVVCTPTVVGCISLHERRGRSGASIPVPADDDSNAVRSGSIIPDLLLADVSGEIPLRSLSLLLTNVEVKHNCGGDDRTNDRRGGKSYNSGNCGGKSFLFSRFTSVHRLLVCF